MTIEARAAGRRPEIVAAFVNALVTLFLPPALLMLLAIVGSSTSVFSNTSVTVHPARSLSDSSWMFMTLFGSMLIPLTPFALIAGWRTWVHARRYCDGRGEGWQGVLEAGAVGFMTALLLLSHGILRRPTDAAPYITFYGGIATLVGLAFGLLLWTTTHLVLRRRATITPFT